MQARPDKQMRLAPQQRPEKQWLAAGDPTITTETQLATVMQLLPVIFHPHQRATEKRFVVLRHSSP
jgi:hypothetical protein